MQLERCPDTKRLHLQGYLEAQGPRSWRCILNILRITTSGGRIYNRRGTRTQAKEYCEKVASRVAGTLPVYFGTFVPERGAGHRSDLAGILEGLRAQQSDTQLLEAFPGSYIRYHRGIAKARESLEGNRSGTRDLKRIVFCVIGDTGSGKTRAISEALEGIDFLPKCREKVWLPEVVSKWSLLDDFRKSTMTLSELLSFIDPWYNSRFESKGDFRVMHSDIIVITSGFGPITWYHDQPDLNHLKRRLTLFFLEKSEYDKHKDWQSVLVSNDCLTEVLKQWLDTHIEQGPRNRK